MPLALPSATVRYGVKSLVYWSRDTGELARSRRRSRDSCRQESVTGLPGWANKAPPTGPGRRVGPRRASGRRIRKKHARVARKRPRSTKPPRRNVSGGSRGTDSAPFAGTKKHNMPVVELLGTIFGSIIAMVPKTAAAAGAGSGTLAKMTTICEQVRVGIAGVLANIAGHPVAVGSGAAPPAAAVVA